MTRLSRRSDRAYARPTTQPVEGAAFSAPTFAFFGQPAKCEVAHKSLPIRPSKVGHGDIYLAPGGDTWHQNQNQPARFVFVFGMAVTILAILTWLSRDLAAPTPPTESIYQPQHLILY